MTAINHGWSRVIAHGAHDDYSAGHQPGGHFVDRVREAEQPGRHRHPLPISYRNHRISGRLYRGALPQTRRSGMEAYTSADPSPLSQIRLATALASFVPATRSGMVSSRCTGSALKTNHTYRAATSSPQPVIAVAAIFASSRRIRD